jgi:signal transduction histidine kinase
VLAVVAAHAGEALGKIPAAHELSDLLGNAVKYSPPGATVRLTVARRNGALVFNVVDTGIGIPESDLPRLGEAFHRAANVGDIPGTGLGLAIVQRSAVLLGGSFRVESEEGRGTTATLILPNP